METELFRIMNQWLGLALPPTMVPIILGLLGRRYGWRSALGGFLGGLAVGIAYQVAKGPLREALPWVSAPTLDGISILINTAATWLTMEAVTLFEKRTEDEKARTEAFFAKLARPVEVPRAEGELPSPFFIVGVTIFFTGVLLLLVGLLELANPLTVMINSSLGILFAALGGSLWVVSRRTVAKAPS